MNDLNTDVEKANVINKKPSWLRPLLYLVIFISGCVVGIGGTLFLVRYSAIYVVHNPDDVPPRIISRIVSALSLNEDQAMKVESIVWERHEAFQNIRVKIHPQFEKEIDLLQEQVSAVLNQEQRDKWLAQIEYFRKTWVPDPAKRSDSSIDAQ